MAVPKKTHTSVTLTATQSVVLRAAACREDGIVALPEKLKGKAAERLMAALLERGLVREIRAKPCMPVSRTEDTGRAHALVITKLGRSLAPAVQDRSTLDSLPESTTAGGLSTEPGASSPRRAGVMEGARTGNEAVTALLPAITPVAAPALPASGNAPRPGSKLGAVIALLSRETGASIEEVMGATGWLPHTTRAALTGLRKRGYEVLRQRDDKGTIYRIGMTDSVRAA